MTHYTSKRDTEKGREIPNDDQIDHVLMVNKTSRGGTKASNMFLLIYVT